MLAVKDCGINTIKCVQMQLPVNRREGSAKYAFLPRWGGDVETKQVAGTCC